MIDKGIFLKQHTIMYDTIMWIHYNMYLSKLIQLYGTETVSLFVCCFIRLYKWSGRKKQDKRQNERKQSNRKIINKISLTKLEAKNGADLSNFESE
jgi:hypothetical protein